jgi:hypothetical protein
MSSRFGGEELRKNKLFALSAIFFVLTLATIMYESEDDLLPRGGCTKSKI